LLSSPGSKIFTSMDVTFYEIKSFYEHPHLQEKSFFQVESFVLLLVLLAHLVWISLKAAPKRASLFPSLGQLQKLAMFLKLLQGESSFEYLESSFIPLSYKNHLVLLLASCIDMHIHSINIIILDIEI